MLTRVAASALLVPGLSLGLTGCGDDPESVAAVPAASPVLTAEPLDAGTPSTSASGTSEADAYARVVMSTNMSEVFSGYTVEGSVVRFSLRDGVTLAEDQCQYLKLSNRALRDAAGLSVVVGSGAGEVKC